MPNQKQLTVLRLIGAKQYATSQTGSAVDLQGYINPGGRNMKATIDCAEGTGTISLAAKLQDSDTTTAADFTDISGGGFTTITTTVGGQQSIHFQTRKRYIRAVTTHTSATTLVTFAISVIVEGRFA